MPAKNTINILVAPLDWGLGHATRCIPIIEHLLQCNCNVIIAAEGSPLDLLKTEFPSAQFVSLPGYRVSYASSKRFFSLKILLQLPKILNAIRGEQKWLRSMQKQRQIDAIISDNRYGLYSSLPAVIITHQLTIKAPLKVLEYLMRKCHYRLLKRFDGCWIPDVAGAPNLAGELSHPGLYPRVPVVYLGPLSRLNKTNKSPFIYRVLVVISGPEPFRSLLEEMLLAQLETFSAPVLFIRGLPGSGSTVRTAENVTIKSHLNAIEMEAAFNQSEWIVSRSGYTTVMDIIKLGKKSILIPTPGQTEQEYLAKHLQAQGWCVAKDQQSFNLVAAMEEAEDFRYRLPELNMGAYRGVLDEFLDRIVRGATNGD